MNETNETDKNCATVKKRKGDTLSTGALAKMYGVTNTTIIRWSKEGKLPAPTMTLGGHRRWKYEIQDIETDKEQQ